MISFNLHEESVFPQVEHCGIQNNDDNLSAWRQQSDELSQIPVQDSDMTKSVHGAVA